MPSLKLRYICTYYLTRIMINSITYLFSGKTMLMDLFYDTVYPFNDEEKKIKRRVHYHDFMLEVHSLMHEAKKKAPPR